MYHRQLLSWIHMIQQLYNSIFLNAFVLYNSCPIIPEIINRFKSQHFCSQKHEKCKQDNQM